MVHSCVDEPFLSFSGSFLLVFVLKPRLQTFVLLFWPLVLVAVW